MNSNSCGQGKKAISEKQLLARFWSQFFVIIKSGDCSPKRPCDNVASLFLLMYPKAIMWVSPDFLLVHSGQFLGVFFCLSPDCIIIDFHTFKTKRSSVGQLSLAPSTSHFWNIPWSFFSCLWTLEWKYLRGNWWKFPLQEDGLFSEMNMIYFFDKSSQSSASQVGQIASSLKTTREQFKEEKVMEKCLKRRVISPSIFDIPIPSWPAQLIVRLNWSESRHTWAKEYAYNQTRGFWLPSWNSRLPTEVTKWKFEVWPQTARAKKGPRITP